MIDTSGLSCMDDISTNTVQCYIRRAGRTLLLHRAKKRNDPLREKWIAVGGKFEPGETPEECVRREVKEETGLDVRRLLPRGVITFVVRHGDERLETCYAFVFECFSFRGTLIDSSEGNLHWVPDAQILQRDILEKDRIFLPWIYERRDFFSAKFFSLGDQLCSHTVSFYGAAAAA